MQAADSHRDLAETLASGGWFQMAPLWRTRPLDRPSVSPGEPRCRSRRMARGHRLLPIVANLRANRRSGL